MAQFYGQRAKVKFNKHQSSGTKYTITDEWMLYTVIKLGCNGLA